MKASYDYARFSHHSVGPGPDMEVAYLGVVVGFQKASYYNCWGVRSGHCSTDNRSFGKKLGCV